MSQTRPREWRTELIPSGDVEKTWSSGARAQDTVVERPALFCTMEAPPLRYPFQPEETTVRLGDYELLRELGRGGMGVVYLARSIRLERDVALKVINAGPGATLEDLERFRIEARSSARLSHPNIVTVHELGEQGSCSYFAMELVEGGCLRSLIKRRGSLEEREAARVAARLARALHHAHLHDVLHRDVKPSNVLVTPDGVPLLTDFGLAKDLASEAIEMTATGDVLGTPAYMSPEQALGESAHVGPQADVYGVGATLYEMLTGQPPFDGESRVSVMRSVVYEEPTPPSRLRTGLDRDLETICLKCLEKDFDQRYDTAQELAEDLDRYLHDTPIVARRPTLLERGQKWLRRNRALAKIVSASAGVLVLGGVISAAWVDRAARSERDARSALAERVLTQTQTEERYREQIQGILLSAERGEVASRPEGIEDAAVRVARYAESNRDAAVLLLGAYLDRISSDLWEVKRALYGELAKPGEVAALERVLAAWSAQGFKPHVRHDEALLEAIEARASNTFDVELSSRQRDRLGEGRLAAAQVVCRALGRIGARDGAVAALGRDLGSQADVSHALPAAQALRRLGGAEARQHLHLLLLDHGPDSAFAQRIRAVPAATADRVLDSDSAAGHFRKAETLFHDGDSAGAVVEYTLAIQGLEGDPRPELGALAHSHRALARVRLGQNSEALADAERATKLQPGSASAWNDRGHVRQACGDLAGALVDYTRALDLDARDHTIWNNRATVRLALGDAEGAIGDCDQGLRVKPGEARLWSNRAKANVANKDLIGALADYGRALELDPHSALVYYERGNVHQASGALQQAILDYDLAIELDPTHVSARLNRGVTRQRQRDLRGAVADYSKVIGLEPGHVGALRNRGIANQGLGDLPGAIDDFSRVIELLPDTAMAWGARGLARARLGHSDAARGDLVRFLSLAPGHRMASEARAALANLR